MSAPGPLGKRADSGPLENGCQALAAANAHRLQQVAPVAPVQLADAGGEDAHACRADRVSEGDARAIDVEPVEVLLPEAPLAGDSEHLRGERLVELDEVD